MRAFSASPQRLRDNLFLSLLGGVFVGSLLFSVVDVGLYGAEPSLASFPMDLLLLMLPALLIGALVVLVYAAPIVLALRRANLAGPASALLVALAPALLFGMLGMGKVAVVFACYGAAVGAIFAARAYRQDEL